MLKYTIFTTFSAHTEKAGQQARARRGVWPYVYHLTLISTILIVEKKALQRGQPETRPTATSTRQAREKQYKRDTPTAHPQRIHNINSIEKTESKQKEFAETSLQIKTNCGKTQTKSNKRIDQNAKT